MIQLETNLNQINKMNTHEDKESFTGSLNSFVNQKDNFDFHLLEFHRVKSRDIDHHNFGEECCGSNKGYS